MSVETKRNSISMNPNDFIPKPCHEDWNAMTGNQQRKFCGKCSTHVHDLTDYSEEGILALKVQNGGRLCGSFRLAKPLTIGAGIASLALASCLPEPVHTVGIICPLPGTLGDKTISEHPTSDIEKIIENASKPGSHAIQRESLVVGLVAVPSEKTTTSPAENRVE